MGYSQIDANKPFAEEGYLVNFGLSKGVTWKRFVLSEYLDHQ